MKLSLNGQIREVEDNMPLLKLIQDSNLNKEKIIIQVDQKIIPKSLYNSYTLQENSQIEILAIVGGGWYEGFFNNSWRTIFIQTSNR